MTSCSTGCSGTTSANAVDQPRADRRGVLAGLEHDRVAGGQRVRDRAHRREDRVVPRPDHADHAVRLVLEGGGEVGDEQARAGPCAAPSTRCGVARRPSAGARSRWPARSSRRRPACRSRGGSARPARRRGWRAGPARTAAARPRPAKPSPAHQLRGRRGPGRRRPARPPRCSTGKVPTGSPVAGVERVERSPLWTHGAAPGRRVRGGRGGPISPVTLPVGNGWGTDVRPYGRAGRNAVTTPPH